MMPRIDWLEEVPAIKNVFKQAEARGHARGVRESLIRLGTRRFGSPDRRIRGRISRINDIDQIDAFVSHLFDFSTWNRLLDSVNP